MPKPVLRTSTARPALFLAGAVLLAGAPGAAVAQDVALDRWLLTAGSAAPAGAENPLGVLPDRDREVGPGYWELVREDGARSIAVSGRAETGEALLAHAYVRASRDVTVRLTLPGGCDRSVWLNGQPLEVPEEGRDVRLGLGWNRLLVTQDADCGAIGGAIGPSDALAPEPDDDDPALEVRVQASHPPGAGPGAPQGTVVLGRVAARQLVWRAGNDRLLASLAWDVTSWGRSFGPSVAGGGDDDAAPELDLSGEWDITVFSPTGIQRLRAELEMADDGELSGRLTRQGDGQRARVTFAGDVRDGWVSGRRFGWTMRLSGERGTGEATFEGTATEGRLGGNVRFGDARDFESRFEAVRPGEAGAATGGERDTPRARPERQPFSVFGPPPDPGGLRARMIRQLLPPTRPPAPAPRSASYRIRIAGADATETATGLAAGTPVTHTLTVEFRKAREAALEPGRVVAEIRWDDEDLDVRGTVDAASLLEALHAPIAVDGLQSGGTAELRVPETLGGFTLRGLGGEWTVGGAPAPDGVLCDPCRRGERLQVGFRASGPGGPAVEVTNPGYPTASGGRPATEWLRALEGDNRRYRELGGSTP